MDLRTLWRALRLGLISLVFGFTLAAGAQEVLPMAVQPSVVASGGKRMLYLTLGNRNNLGMDTIKITAVGGSDAKFGELPTLNPYQWQTVSGALPNDAQAVVVEYVCNDKPQKLSVSLVPAGTSSVGMLMPISSGGGMPSLMWLGGALLIGAFVGIAGAAVGKRSAR
jgi:hypothetical protein